MGTESEMAMLMTGLECKMSCHALEILDWALRAQVVLRDLMLIQGAAQNESPVDSDLVAIYVEG